MFQNIWNDAVRRGNVTFGMIELHHPFSREAHVTKNLEESAAIRVIGFAVQTISIVVNVCQQVVD